MAYKHVYKLKMTVDGVEHTAPIVWNDALNNVFNKRKRRISDYRGAISPSYTDALSSYLTFGIGLTSDAEIPMIPMKTNWNYKGFRNNDYTNISGSVGKVALMCERIPRNASSSFYDMDQSVLLKSSVVGTNINDELEYNGEEYVLLGLADDGESLYAVNKELVSYELKDVKLAKLSLPDTKFGLDGVEGLGAFRRGQASQGKIRANGMVILSKNDINHNYTYNPSDINALFDVDEEEESQTFDDTTITYKTWNCFFFGRNDSYGASAGTSIVHDENYIYVFEYILGAIVRIGQYNAPSTPYSEFAFRPQNCDVYYNMTTRQIEGLGTTEFKPLINYAVIKKETMEVMQENSIFLDNRFNIDLSDLIYTGISSTITDTVMKLDENTLTDAVISTNQYLFRAFATCADDDNIYFELGYKSNSYRVMSLDSSEIQGESLPETLSLDSVSAANISDFCHTINRTNLFKLASYRSGRIANLGCLVDKKTGIVNWYGFIDWLVSGVADFGGINVSAGQTVRFELKEEIIEE